MNKFDAIEGFNENEQYNGKNAWGDPDKVDLFLLWILGRIRYEIRKLDPGATITVHCAFETKGHNGKTHPLGIAADWHINTRIPYHEQIGLIILILHDYGLTNLVGLGIYPCWNSKGFHLDHRGIKARWGYVLDVEKSTPKAPVFKMVSFDQARDVALLLEMEEAS